MWPLVIQRIAFDFIIDLLFFPFWWYTRGLKQALLFCIELIKNVNIYLAPFLWLKNIFVPMYGQTDWQGRLMSFFMRLVNIVVRFIGMMLWVVIVFFIFMLWIAFPIFITYMLFMALFAGASEV